MYDATEKMPFDIANDGHREALLANNAFVKFAYDTMGKDEFIRFYRKQQLELAEKAGDELVPLCANPGSGIVMPCQYYESK